MSELGNEFNLWPSRFMGEIEDMCALSQSGRPPSSFRVAETRVEIHKRLGQTRILDRITNRERGKNLDRAV